MRTLSRTLAVGLVLLTAGCFQIEQHVTLDRSLSGTADFLMAMDMEMMVPMMASMNRAFSGQGGPPTEQDMEMARQQLRQSIEQDMDQEGPLDLDEMREDLPDGVRLLNAELSHEELQTRTSFNFEFDDIRTLAEMSFDEQANEGKTSEGGDPMESPFGNLEVIEEDGTLVIRSASPLEEVGEQQNEMMEGAEGMMQGMDEAMKEMFRGMRVVFTLEAPFDVVEHNATRVDGDRLIWEYGADDFEGVAEGRVPTDEGIFVRYRR